MVDVVFMADPPGDRWSGTLSRAQPLEMTIGPWAEEVLKQS
jgi:hypothetical protein